MKIMDDKKFCELYNNFYGDEIDKIEQINFHKLKGEELKEFVDYCLEKVEIYSNVREEKAAEYWHQRCQKAEALITAYKEYHDFIDD